MLDGVLVLDKPLGLSSNAALQRAKRLFNAAKAGHTGALDPLASGVLPLCFGEATKFSQFVLDADKAYRSRFLLGVHTASGDADSEILSVASAADISLSQVETALEAFRGEIEQRPSMYSALKHEGQPLYKLARQGIEIERKRRRVTIHALDLIEFVPGERAEVVVDVRCSKGTYIRSIAEDLGQMLGCGAHVIELRRTAAGPYSLEDCVSLEQLEQLRDQEDFAAMDQQLLPVDSSIADLPEVELCDDSVFYMLRGQPVMVSGLPRDGLARMRDENGKFIGLGRILDDGRIAPQRLIAN